MQSSCTCAASAGALFIFCFKTVKSTYPTQLAVACALSGSCSSREQSAFSVLIGDPNCLPRLRWSPSHLHHHHGIPHTLWGPHVPPVLWLGRWFPYLGILPVTTPSVLLQIRSFKIRSTRLGQLEENTGSSRQLRHSFLFQQGHSQPHRAVASFYT